MNRFSFARLFAMLIKELLQMRRDRATVGLTVMLPLVQLFLFGYAINANPRHLPTGLLARSTRPMSARSRRRCRTPATSTSSRWRARTRPRRRWRAAT